MGTSQPNEHLVRGNTNNFVDAKFRIFKDVIHIPTKEDNLHLVFIVWHLVAWVKNMSPVNELDAQLLQTLFAVFNAPPPHKPLKLFSQYLTIVVASQILCMGLTPCQFCNTPICQNKTCQIENTLPGVVVDWNGEIQYITCWHATDGSGHGSSTEKYISLKVGKKVSTRWHW